MMIIINMSDMFLRILFKKIMMGFTVYLYFYKIEEEKS